MLPATTENIFVQANEVFDFEHLNLAWLVVFAIIWSIFRKGVVLSTKLNPSKTVGFFHTILCILVGIPVIILLGDKSFEYSFMMESIIDHRVPLSIICHLGCYMSVGYFLMDSYFLMERPYLKHHIGAICVWISAALHYEASLIHCVVLVCLFEIGAVIVQLSRTLRNILWLRALLCVGDTITRFAVAWYWGFTLYTSYVLYFSNPLIYSIFNIPIHIGLCFLVFLNFNWTYFQWKALAVACKNPIQCESYSYVRRTPKEKNPVTSRLAA